MIISEKQIMQLMSYTWWLINRMMQENAFSPEVKAVIKVIEDINNQQSEELKVIE